MQASTRYIDYQNFAYVTPSAINQRACALNKYEETMAIIAKATKELIALGVPKEDAAMLLPLGMSTKIVDRRNLRNLIEMSHQRLCNRAYWEYSQLMKDIRSALADYSPEWKYLTEKYFLPKCCIQGKCTEKRGCGKTYNSNS